MRRDACPRPDARAPSSVVTCARLSCATRRRVCDPRRLTQPASQPRPRSFPRAQLRARRQAHAQCGARDGEARRRRPPACGRPPANHARMARHKGGGEGHSNPHPYHPACLCAGLLLPRERAPKETKPDSRDVARLTCAAPSRVIQRTHMSGAGGRSAVTTSEYERSSACPLVFDCFRFMDLAEIGRCRASVSPPQTHQGGLLSSISMAVAVCWGCPHCSARWVDTSVSVCGYAAVRERASERRTSERASVRRTSERASGERAIERRASERASGAQQTMAHSDTSASVCGSQRASERAESERASKQQ